MAHRVRLVVRVFIVFIALQSCTNNTPSGLRMYNLAHLSVQRRNGLLLNDNRPFTGIIYTLFPNKKDTFEIVCFKQGREDGVWKKYYEDGQPMEERYYSSGLKVGDFKAWWPNGVLKLYYHFKNGEYEGSCKEWTDKGVLIQDMNYKNGYEDGSQKQFYNDGKVKANYVIVNGRRYGLLGTKNCVNVSDSIFKK